MNLLIVDDEIVTTQVLEEQLDRALLSIDQIYVAYNTSMARDILQKNKVELILCDIEMPKENGIHFLEYRISWKRKKFRRKSGWYKKT